MVGADHDDCQRAQPRNVVPIARAMLFFVHEGKHLYYGQAACQAGKNRDGLIMEAARLPQAAALSRRFADVRRPLSRPVVRHTGHRIGFLQGWLAHASN